MLTKNKIILEATSGNTGISVAWVSALEGYKCVIIMPRSASVERRRIMKALGFPRIPGRPYGLRITPKWSIAASLQPHSLRRATRSAPFSGSKGTRCLSKI